MSKILRDISLRDFGASLNTVESYTDESSQGKIELCETVNKQKCTHLGMLLSSEGISHIKFPMESYFAQSLEKIDNFAAELFKSIQWR